MTSARIVCLYEAMDAAYDAEIIDRHSKALGHAPLIDRNFRSQHEAKTECAEEVARMRRVGVPDPDDRLFDFRTMAERVNARMKTSSAPGSCACAAPGGDGPTRPA
jgi:hypothetical protein